MRTCERRSPIGPWDNGGTPCMERPPGSVIHRHIRQWNAIPYFPKRTSVAGGCPQIPFGICRWYKRIWLAINDTGFIAVTIGKECNRSANIFVFLISQKFTDIVSGLPDTPITLPSTPVCRIVRLRLQVFSRFFHRLEVR